MVLNHKIGNRIIYSSFHEIYRVKIPINTELFTAFEIIKQKPAIIQLTHRVIHKEWGNYIFNLFSKKESPKNENCI